MASEVDDRSWMAHALELAKLGSGRVSPNPRVGCVIVDNTTILAEGWHKEFGGPHAEAVALSALNVPITPTSTLYVTLEPCNHFGKTPPCSDAIVESGIKRVVVGSIDSNPNVSMQGIEKLKGAGIDVTTGVLKEECDHLNRSFFKHITTGMPYVTLKLAFSVDGVIAPYPLKEYALTGMETQKRVHELRSEIDAVMVGVGTVIVDDPSLNVRKVIGRDPIRIVVDPRGEIPIGSRFVSDAHNSRSYVVASVDVGSTYLSDMANNDIQTILVESENGSLDMRDALDQLGSIGVASILCEGGAFLATELLKADLVDEFRANISSKLIGEGLRVKLPGTSSFALTECSQIENDLLLNYRCS